MAMMFRAAGLAFGLALGAWLGPVAAQGAYPSRPITIVVTAAAGGSNNFVARVLGDRLAESLQQPVVIENVPAANGSVAATQVARSAPDGYTLMMAVDSTLTVNPHLYPKLNYDAAKDFAPISIITRIPMVVVAGANTQAKSLQELIALAKANPGKMNYASTGIGSALHIGVELLKLMTQIDIVHVPYRGTPGALTDLAGGRIDMLIISQTSSKPLADQGKAKLLAIAAPARSPLIPDVPTTAEAGVPGYEVSSWFGLFAPAGTPQPIIDLLAREVKKASTDPRFIGPLMQQGMEIVADSPEEMRVEMEKTSKKWGDVIKATGVTLQ